ncbi:MAG: hypothetical protein ACJ8G3_23810 [Burkholderiaceae bacterium]
MPAIFGLAIQVASLALLLYTPPMGAAFDFILCFIFGFGNSAHMLAFSTAADVVDQQNIGTSAALVNGFMFILGGILISRPGLRIGLAIDAGIVPKSLELAQFAARPLLIGSCLALAITLVMRETYPRASVTTK